MPRSTINEDLNINRKARPLAPNSSISVNSDTGSDLNDGFTSSIASIEKLQDILARYNFDNQYVTISISGSTLESTALDINLSGVANIDTLEFNFGTRTEEVRFFNSMVPIKIKFTNFDGNDAGIFFAYCFDAEVGAGTSFRNVTSGSSIQAFGCNRVRVGIIGYTNYNSSGDVIYIDSVNDFSYDPLSSPTAVGTVLRTTGYVGNIRLENGTASITGQILNIASSGVNIEYQGWAWTGTVADTFPNFCVVNDVPKFSNLGIHVDDTAAGIAGLTQGDVYQTAAGDLKVKL